ncbi:hypothetical protein PsalMR5_03689 [Piscirickettsia salmonis]|uniref:hypothetical protein n=2 Tax=Piscirickettsia salmonis TaxID=1238 RepID=UPI0012BA63A0|nr:hypothetical protein [Piscirickettsia salmonis]QGP56208.1 hypothetical protein PsalSR1_03684 [Piscirickettsia salmonis]QGP57916.1 hypothetical protein PsalBI1_00463 [Piscirickettsia salmonis]QGP65777.1 hypothetical protein PsalMR5_03689 [Piscirickettsia salmonis]
MRRKVFVFDLTSITSADREYQQRIRSIIKDILKNGDKVVFTAVKNNMPPENIALLSGLYRDLAQELGLNLKEEPDIAMGFEEDRDKYVKRQLEVMTEYLRDPIEIADDRDFTAGLTARNKRLNIRTKDKKEQPRSSLPEDHFEEEEEDRFYLATPKQHATYKRELNHNTSAFSFRPTSVDNKNSLLRDISVNGTIIGVKSRTDVVLVDSSPQALKAAKSAYYTTVTVESTLDGAPHLGQLEAMVAKQTQAKQQLIESIQKHLAGLEKYQQKQVSSSDPNAHKKAEKVQSFIDKTQALLNEFNGNGQKVSKRVFEDYRVGNIELINDISQHRSTASAMAVAYLPFYARLKGETGKSSQKAQEINSEVAELMRRSISTISPDR